MIVSGSRAEARPPGKQLKPGKVQVLGRYPKKRRRDGKKTVRYYVLEEGNKFRLRVGGPASIVLLARGFGKNRVTFDLQLDGAQEDQAELQVVMKVSRGLYIEVPEGTHRVIVKPSAKVLVRPVRVRRQAMPGELVVVWKGPTKDIPVVPLVAMQDPPTPEPPPAPPKPVPSPAPTLEKLVREPPKIESEPDPTPRYDRLRVAFKLGGVLPRKELDATLGYSLSVELPLPLGSSRGLSIYLEGGYALLKHQGTRIIPGRGMTNLIQNTHTIPLELGIRYRLGRKSWRFRPYAGMALALDVSTTTFIAFSTGPADENELSLGFVGALGGLIRVGPGGILAEVRYREVGSGMEALDAGEDTLSAVSFWLGYEVAI